MASIPNVGSVMTPNAIQVDVDATVGVAEDLMTDNEVRHLVVMDSGSLVGALSDRDLAFAAASPDGALRDRLHVRDVCSFDVFVVEPHEPLDRIVSVMAERHVGSAIVSEEGKVVGVFTATDACRYLGTVLRGA